MLTSTDVIQRLIQMLVITDHMVFESDNLRALNLDWFRMLVTSDVTAALS